LGLVTNGILVGRASEMVPITRNYKQLPAILEVLARLQMKSRGDLIDLFRRELELPWGMSCVYFAYEEDGTLAAAEEYFLYRRTPVKFLICQPRLNSEEYGSGIRHKIHSLDEITFREGLRE
jgi:hypothetical protein